MNSSELILSPCIGVCSIEDDSPYCRGCFRTLAEVSAWSVMTPERKRAVLELLAKRKREQAA